MRGQGIALPQGTAALWRRDSQSRRGQGKSTLHSGAPDGDSQPDLLTGGKDCVWLGPISGTSGESEDGQMDVLSGTC